MAAPSTRVLHRVFEPNKARMRSPNNNMREMEQFPPNLNVPQHYWDLSSYPISHIIVIIVVIEISIAPITIKTGRRL